MDKINETKKRKMAKLNTLPVRVLRPTAKSLKGILLKLNKKSYGRKVRPDDVIAKSLSLLNDSHLQEIQEATMTNMDKIDMAYHNYCKNKGQISKDAYLGRLLSNKEVSVETDGEWEKM